MRRRHGTRAWACGIGAGAALAVLSACSTFDGLGSSSPSASSPPPASSSSSSFSQRFSNFVLGGGSSTTAQGDMASPQSDIDCPTVNIRQGASSYSQSATDNGSEALSLRFQASFVRFARECALRGKDVTLKVGVEGRVILGPAGVPGQIMLPVRLAVVKEGLNPQTIWTKFYMVPVTLPPGEPFTTFTHVEEDMTFPMPPGSQFDQYVIYAGFDPASAVPEPRKKQVRPAARKPKPRPPAAAPPQ